MGESGFEWGAYTDTTKKFAFYPKSWYYKNITFQRKTYHRHFCINKKITLDMEKQCYAHTPLAWYRK